MKLPYRILVLDDDEHALAGIVEMLRDVGYLVTGAATYDAAKRLLGLGSYDLLITDVRLRGFNGLHLVRQSHQDCPEMATIIITGYDEPMIEIEAGRYGAEFVRKPLKTAEFLKTVTRCLGEVRRQRRWPRKRVVGGFRVTADGRPAAVVDVCYGGLRLEVPAGEQLPHELRHRDRRHRPAPRSGIRVVPAVERRGSGHLRSRAVVGRHPCRTHLARHRRSADRVNRLPRPADRAHFVRAVRAGSLTLAGRARLRLALAGRPA